MENHIPKDQTPYSKKYVPQLILHLGQIRMHLRLRLAVRMSTVRLSSILDLRRAKLLSSVLSWLSSTILQDPILLDPVRNLVLNWMGWLRGVVDSGLLVGDHLWLLLVTHLIGGMVVL